VVLWYCYINHAFPGHCTSGVPGFAQFENDAFQQFYDNGILLVAAAGNEGTTAFNWPASCV
jgi:serine protease